MMKRGKTYKEAIRKSTSYDNLLVYFVIYLFIIGIGRLNMYLRHNKRPLRYISDLKPRQLVI